MTHPTEDTLLKHALELHDAPSHREEIEAHLAMCQSCSTQFDRIRNDLSVISGIRPQSRPAMILQGRSTATMRTYFRIAALLVLGFAAGFVTSELVERKPASVVPSALRPTPPARGYSGVIESDATQVQYPQGSGTAL